MAEKMNMEPEEIQREPAEAGYLKAAMFLTDSYSRMLESKKAL